MIAVKKEDIIIQKTLLHFKNEGVLNPASIKEGNNVHLFYRAVSNGNFSGIAYSKLDGRLYFLHRIKPDIQIVVAVNELMELTPEFWENYFIGFEDTIVLAPQYYHESSYTGGGCPPIETEFGWLLIYHGVEDTIKGFVYSACASLLDLHDPQKEIARLPYPLFKPELSWELKGEVNTVCFPSGTALFGDTLYIYYGAADERVGCASLNQSELLKELMLNIIDND